MPGFPIQAINFYKELKENNNREWFLDHKKDYVEFVQEPAIDFVLDLGKKLQTVIPNIQFDTTTNGSGSIMRIYRDTRFSKDKTPYKNWLGIRFWEGADRKHCASRFFFYINSEGGGVYVGSHHFEKPHLFAYQESIDNNDAGAELEKIVNSLRKSYEIGGEKYKRVPKSFAQDHVRGDLLKHKAMYAHFGNISVDDVTGNDLSKLVIKHFKKLAPLHTWLCTHVQETAR